MAQFVTNRCHTPSQPTLLNSTTVHDEGVVDVLTGGSGMNWFYANITKEIIKKKTGDLVVNIAGW